MIKATTVNPLGAKVISMSISTSILHLEGLGPGGHKRESAPIPANRLAYESARGTSTQISNLRSDSVLVIQIDCHELTLDEQLALAAAISDELHGKAIALIRDVKILIDPLKKDKTEPTEVEAIARHFLSRRKDALHYSVERVGDSLLIRSPDPIARARGRKMAQLPGNLLQCPFCPFVTPYQELYNVHVRAHGALLGF